MSQLTVPQLETFLRGEFADDTTMIESAGDRRARIRKPITREHARPGDTVSGPTMMALADRVVYIAILAEIGLVPLAVTTNLNISFMRKPSLEKDLIAEAFLLKLGRRLAVAEVKIFVDGEDELVAHATVTYSIPPRK
jgi:uncharacterized protein (TIGR00369 family)